jgi:hypothetical protein
VLLCRTQFTISAYFSDGEVTSSLDDLRIDGTLREFADWQQVHDSCALDGTQIMELKRASLLSKRDENRNYESLQRKLDMPSNHPIHFAFRKYQVDAAGIQRETNYAATDAPKCKYCNAWLFPQGVSRTKWCCNKGTFTQHINEWTQPTTEFPDMCIGTSTNAKTIDDGVEVLGSANLRARKNTVEPSPYFEFYKDAKFDASKFNVDNLYTSVFYDDDEDAVDGRHVGLQHYGCVKHGTPIALICHIEAKFAARYCTQELIIDNLYILDDTPRRFSFLKLETAVSFWLRRLRQLESILRSATSATFNFQVDIESVCCISGFKLGTQPYPRPKIVLPEFLCEVITMHCSAQW